MPIITPEKVRIPAGGDAYDLTSDLRRMSETTRSVVPVGSVTERDAVAAAMASVDRPVTADNPLLVYRADAPAGMRLEVSQDGATWRPVSNTAWIGDQAFGSVAGGAVLNVTVNFPGGYFSTPPLVVCSFRNTSSFTAGTGTPSTTSVVVTVRNVTGGASNGILTVYAQAQP